MAEITKKDVEKVLNEKVRPVLAEDEGDIEVVDVEDGVVIVKFIGACMNCPSSTITLNNTVKMELLDAMPEIKDVVVEENISEDILYYAKKIIGHDL